MYNFTTPIQIDAQLDIENTYAYKQYCIPILQHIWHSPVMIIKQGYFEVLG